MSTETVDTVGQPSSVNYVPVAHQASCIYGGEPTPAAAQRTDAGRPDDGPAAGHSGGHSRAVCPDRRRVAGRRTGRGAQRRTQPSRLSGPTPGGRTTDGPRGTPAPRSPEIVGRSAVPGRRGWGRRVVTYHTGDAAAKARRRRRGGGGYCHCCCCCCCCCCRYCCCCC